MPIRQFLILLGLFALCLAVVGIAWATGNELYIWMPQRYGPPIKPPTHPLVFIVFFVVLGFWELLVGRGAGVGLGVITGCLFVSSMIGWFAFKWTPTLCQYLLSVAMLVLTIYYLRQKDYIEDD
jgi:hypothetical protein